MPEYRIAHIREQGQDMIIVPLESRFLNRPAAEKESFRLALQRCAAQHRLKGTDCLVWNYGRRFYFLAPPPWRLFFKGLSMAAVNRNINKKITCR